ncbi:acyl carrier protein [Calidifontibacillus oryziterrae]|uniref:acyl carrier protein n=1 Tax=Calidifontibacillus oryziterrae TaxID=1191699 RepID=UPI0003069F8D|nr:acyl carrier protein [Calidifontibacillus oryziterrae]
MNLHKLRGIFAETLGIPEAQVTDDLQYNRIEEWDSIAHMALVSAIDDGFEIMMDTDDVIELSSFAKAKEILKKYGVEF